MKHELVGEAEKHGDASCQITPRFAPAKAPERYPHRGRRGAIRTDAQGVTAHLDAVATALPNATRRILPGQGHRPAAEAMVPVLVEFLRPYLGTHAGPGRQARTLRAGEHGTPRPAEPIVPSGN